MEKLKMGIRVFVLMLLMLLMQVHVFATQVYEESENITDTESVVGQDLTEKNETNKTGQAAFNIHINVPDGFMDEIQLLFISQETEDEFECVLTQENQYAMSFLLNGSQTYDLMYYYKSYKEYEIAEIPDYYECGTESLWDVTYDMIVRSEPTNKKLTPLFGDMDETELEQQNFVSDIFPGMSEDDVIDWYYNKIKEIRKKQIEDDWSPFVNGTKNKSSKRIFKGVSGTNEEWDELSDEQILTFYYACVLPYIIIQNNDFDYDEYMDKLELFSKQCKQLKMTDLYDVTERLWQYIWQYQREKHQMPNFATNCLTMFRSEKNQENLTNDISEKEQSGNNSDNVNTQSEERLGTIIIRMLLNHIWSWVLFIISGILLVYLRKKEKDDKKGVTKR